MGGASVESDGGGVSFLSVAKNWFKQWT
jgi:hypothetical protein